MSEKLKVGFVMEPEVKEMLDKMSDADLRTLSGTLEKLIRDEHDRRQRQERDYEHG